MGCLSREAKEQFLRQFWEAQERVRNAFIRDLQKARRAADQEQDPYRKRLLVWASNNWDTMETVAYEDSPGLYGTAYAALPEDLRADMQRGRVSADPDRVLSPEEREWLETTMLRHEERESTGGPCPQTEARFRELSERRILRGQNWINADQLKEIHRRVTEASKVYDPKDLPG